MASYHSSCIDEDLWPDILKRVNDLKALCRFRCVCKSWNSLLFSFHSILKLTSNPADKSYLLINGYNRYIEPTYVYHPPATRRKRAMTYLDCPFRTCDEFRRLIVVGVVHGLLCLSSDNQCRFKVWMPLMNKYVDIPFLRKNGGHGALGFGYDASKNDFKVVRYRSCPPMCDVFSLQDRLWRSTDFGPDFGGDIVRPMIRSISFFMNGGIYWICTRHKRTSVCLLVFDCEREKLTTMEGPPNFARPPVSNSVQRVSKYQGRLSLLDYSVSREGELLEVWVMEECGTARTWNKVISIRYDNSSMSERQPVMFIDDGMISLPPPLHGHLFRIMRCFSMLRFPLHGLALEETVLSTDPRIKALSYQKKEEDGKVFYLVNGSACDYITV